MFAMIGQIDGVPVVYQRPDSIDILFDDEAKRRLPRYFKILKGLALPKFLIAKLVEVEYDRSDGLEDLWKAHDEGLKEFYRLRDELSESELIDLWKKAGEREKNLLMLKRDVAWKVLEKCSLCRWRCGVNRLESNKCVCRLDKNAYISTVFIHIGEEPELVPSYTIFFSHCNFKCVFCQNWDISQFHSGNRIPPKTLAEAIEREWRDRRIRNTNWVGGEPTPNLHYILDVLVELKDGPPVVWNTNFYASLETMRILDGIVDIWLPDFKYGNNECAQKYSKIPKYFDVVSRNFKILSDKGEEVIIRHLIMPNHVECCTIPILTWIKENMDLSHVRLNLMDQYRPEYQASKYPEITRRIKRSEWDTALKTAKELGISLTL